MRLFLDLDETLIYPFARWRHESERPTNANWQGAINLEGGSYELYFRRDLDFLQGIPFTILSMATQPYVDQATEILREYGFRVREGFGGETVEAGEILTEEPSFLIDNLGMEREMPQAKMALLPAGSFLQVDSWDVVQTPPLSEWKGRGPLSTFLKRRQVLLELIRRGDSKSLEECLAIALGS